MIKLTESEIRIRVEIWMETFREDPQDRFAKGQIVAFRSVLGEDTCEVLDELHAIANE